MYMVMLKGIMCYIKIFTDLCNNSLKYEGVNSSLIITELIRGTAKIRI